MTLQPFTFYLNIYSFKLYIVQKEFSNHANDSMNRVQKLNERFFRIEEPFRCPLSKESLRMYHKSNNFKK